MNLDDLTPIEALLRNQPLRQPSRQLDERVGAARWAGLSATARRRRQQFALGVAVAIAATLTVMVVYGVRYGPAMASRGAASPPGPVQIEQVRMVLAAGDVVTSAQGAPCQRVERQIVRDVLWIDEGKQVRIEWKIPSADSVLVPLEYN